ncbi:MAG: DUF4037 domain-containing protein [Caldilineales bacterium]|nr:DUF4037 domain-containing protein [Caldilineales bacterium]
MSESIIEISHGFFLEHVAPILARDFPDEFAQMAFGVWGLGSEALRMDDEYSRDHHWGLRIDTLMPNELFQSRRKAILEALNAELPSSYQGHSLGEQAVSGAGINPEPIESFLARTIGIDHPPDTYEEWLGIPEEDIIHVINGEVWHDPLGRFTAVRETLQQYYPEPVRLRRIAHWCRYYSGMGTYALKRAILRDNDYYASIAFGKAIRRAVHLAFMLEKHYYPYDKWTMAFFARLPRLYEPLHHVVDEAVRPATGWERKLDLLDQIADVLDAMMVADGIIPPHPQFVGSETSGYRLMEWAYYEIIRKLGPELVAIIPQWEQIYLEKSVAPFVAGLDAKTWQAALNLTPISE